MGLVYRAYDPTADRVVALKVLPIHLARDFEFEQRFRREARIAASLNDPHIVPIHRYGEIDGQLYVEMRLIEGRDLGEYIAENGGRLVPERAVAVIEQIALALDAAHGAGLVHRDVKPQNILVTTHGDFVYLIDFGIARAAADTALTHTGQTMGSMAYMAPERFRGATVDYRVDVYSLACVLYECLTGRRPYPGESLEEQLNAHLNTSPPLPSETADALIVFDAVVTRGMAKDLEDRYQTAIELATAARAALEDRGKHCGGDPTQSAALVIPRPTFPTPGPGSLAHDAQADPSPRRRASLGIGLSALVLCAVTALVVASVTRSHSPTNVLSTPSGASGNASEPETGGASPPVAPLPPFDPPTDLGANCQYPASGQRSPKPVNPPPSGKVPTTPAVINALISTNFGGIGIQLANAKAPCTVNSFTSLVKQHFFDDATCSRMANLAVGSLLQCGGPANDESGGPGYKVDDEYPVNQYRRGDPALKQPAIYPRGALIMIHDDRNANGSQFAMVYHDSLINPEYTVFGTVDENGLATVDKIAKLEISNGNDEGRPGKAVVINSVHLS
jgi:serine/threonine protein kinase